MAIVGEVTSWFQVNFTFCKLKLDPSARILIMRRTVLHVGEADKLIKN
jgi:hypothetical protein